MRLMFRALRGGLPGLIWLAFWVWLALILSDR